MKPRIDWKKLTRDLDFANLLPFVLVFPVAFLSYLFVPYTQVRDELLQTILAAASFIAAVIAGFLFNAYFHLKELQLEKLARFAELQNHLKPYQEAFFRFSEQLLRRYTQIDFQLRKSVHDLHRDEKFMKSDESVAIIWVHSLYDIGRQSYDTPDFEITNSILNKERLNELYDAVIQAEPLLSRYKYYKYILRELKLKDTQDFEQIIIADNSFGVEYIAKTITKNPAVEDYRTLSFWLLKLEECHDILERMRSNGRFIYDFVVRKIES